MSAVQTPRNLPPAPATKGAHLEPVAAKVPAIALTFWAIKLLTTGIGEALCDGLGQIFVPLAAVVGIGSMYFAFRAQYARREYHAWTYWSAVLAVAIFGTMVADGIKDGAGLSYAVTTPFFAAGTAAVFFLWYRSEGTLSIHSITTRRRENFYWAAVLGTFALGTAAGDLTAYTLNLGFFTSALIFGAAMALVAAAWRFGGLNPIVAFWTAYVITRPLGASIADGLSKPKAESGLGYGDLLVGLVGLAIFLVAVAWVARTKHDIQDPAETHAYDHAPYPHAEHLHEQVHPEERARAEAAERTGGAAEPAATSS